MFRDQTLRRDEKSRPEIEKIVAARGQVLRQVNNLQRRWRRAAAAARAIFLTREEPGEERDARGSCLKAHALYSLAAKECAEISIIFFIN